uniref:Uncharacterized protein n=1 Tax=Molossus molossus TaxID=27622 RepID=A0A7J8BYC3_MOLMO|nr:hypothetical protein HJG59_010009 [Molossus molossus]
MTKPEQCRDMEQKVPVLWTKQPATTVSGPSGPFTLRLREVHQFGRSWIFPGRRQWEQLGPSNLSPPAHLAPSNQWTLYINTGQYTVGGLPRCRTWKPHTAQSPAPSPIVAARSESRYTPSNKGWGADIHPQATQAQTSS